jgi:TM2 domain-containing membrane protein YozV
MVDQATMNNGRNAAPAAAMTRNMSDLTSDIASLAELQARLILLDAKESMTRITTPLVLAVIGGALLLGSLPVLLLAIAAGLVLLGLGSAAALLIAFLIGAVLGAIALAIAWYRLRNALVAFQRSRKELVQNIRWIKGALSAAGRASQAAECNA